MVAAYAAASGLRPGAPAGRVEVSVRTTPWGGQVAVARRTQGDVTVGIAARVL